MVDPVQVSPDNGVFIGRVNEADTRLPKVYSSFNAIFNGTTLTGYTIDFSTINTGGQAFVFGVPMGMFIDNSSNPEEVEVYISGTDSYFTVPAQAEGYFKLDARTNSSITFSSIGVATDKVTITIYNHPVAPNVWYKFGAFNTDKAIKVYGTMPENANIAASANHDPAYIGGIDRATGLFHGIAVDAQGRLDFSSSISIGAVTIANGGDVAQGSTTDAANIVPTTAGTVVSWLKGMIQNLNSLITLGTSIFNQIVTSNTNLVNLFNQQVGPPTGTPTVVTSVVTNVVILAANTARKGAVIYNNSTSILRINLGTASALTSWTTEVMPSTPFILNRGDYTGIINGTWIAVNGDAHVTEMV